MPKRKASSYNKFMGKCLKAGNIKSFGQAGKQMKVCALKWKKLTPTQKARY